MNKIRAIMRLLSEGLSYRAELFSLEFGEELRRFRRLTGQLLIIAFAGFSAFFFFNFAILLAFWDTYRLQAAIGIFLFNFLMTLLIVAIITRQNQKREAPFPEMRHVLKEDVKFMQENSKNG